MALVYAPRKKRSRRKSVGGDGRIAVRSAFAQAALVDSDLFYASGFISVFQENRSNPQIIL
jgi:hypothetical protein